jgi:hypothetical protein
MAERAIVPGGATHRRDGTPRHTAATRAQAKASRPRREPVPARPCAPPPRVSPLAPADPRWLAYLASPDGRQGELPGVRADA